jgi:antirestriction protein ArdC
MSEKIYEIITERIVSLLEKGCVPWQQPWSAEQGFPKNLVSQKEYRGVNPFLLASMGYTSPYFLSFKQAKELGGSPRKGEHGCPVVFWKQLEVADVAAKDGKKKIPMLRYYTVFNVTQCDGIPTVKIPKGKAFNFDHKPIESAQRIVDAMPKRPEIKSGVGRAFYSPSSDFVGMPSLAEFRSPEDYHSVLFHELVHATGHASRLGRKCVTSSDGEWSAFGTAPYAREELVAEMGAAFLAGHAGIIEQTILPTANYLASWIERLKDDPKLIVQAAANAQRASDFILGKNLITE